MDPINRRQGARSSESEDRVQVIGYGNKYYATTPVVCGPFDNPRDAYRAALDRKQGLLLARRRLRSRRASVSRFHRAGLRPAPLSEKSVSAVAETASSLTLQEADDSSTSSLQESISASPGTVPHNIIDASWRPSTSSCEKLVAGASESASASASAQTLGEADVSSWEELINDASVEELVTASPRTAPCNNTLDGSSTTSPFRREKTVAGVAESARTQVLRELDLELDQLIVEEGFDFGYSSSEDLTTTSQRAVEHNVIDDRNQTALCNNTLELELDQFTAEDCFDFGYSSSEDLTTTSQRAVEHNVVDGRDQCTVLRNTTDGILPSASSLGSKILSHCVPRCFYEYYIRMDHRGSFRIYPDIGGPFQSLQEAQDAINRHHNGLWCRSWRDVQARAPGGGRYSSTREISNADTYLFLIEALLDKYNEDNNLIGDLAHELDEDAMMEQWIYEDHSYYYHYNFTTKKNKAGDISLGACTFFAEVSHKLGEHALEVNCCCKIEDEDNGWCYGCKNNGSHGMRHPKNLEAYKGGHLDVFLPCTLEEPSSSDDEEANETRLRNISKDNTLSCVSGSLFLQQASAVES